ncbi:DUF962 domain-containing protein [Oceanobacter mangrovi]|uniref:Mpo1 family 2-hydroxy fatty acid dioxygenase n=1 Tax=Oceanobacter mangrovi TaxID=2862510 RepID=UPI001C8EA4EA|nr:Mpo1-like protein [Oceanobacter mangrovi]
MNNQPQARTLQQWFDLYGESHQHTFNKLIHWLCVPLIYWVVVGFIYLIPSPADWPEGLWLVPVLLAVTVFYWRLSAVIAIGMLVFSLLCILTHDWLQGSWGLYGAVFVVLWILQFIGHQVEGKRPSFFVDVQFLLIGPAWLLGKIYRRMGWLQQPHSV